MARKINRGGLIKGITIPNFSAGVDQQVSTQLYGTLAGQLDSMFKFANKLNEQELIKEATEFAVDNPIKLEDYLNANPIERAEMFQGNDYTTFGKQLKATQANVLATDMAMSATSQMNTIKAEAMLNDTDMEIVEQNLNALVNGYVGAMADLDPETATILKGKLATTASSKYSTVLDDRITNINKARKAEAMAYAEGKIADVIDLFDGTYESTILDQNGDEIIINVDDKYNYYKNTLVSELTSKRFSSDEIKSFIIKLDEKFIKSKKNKLFKETVLSGEDKDINKIVKGVTNGTFNGDESSRKMFESLPIDEQKDFKKQVREYRENFIKDQDNKEKAQKAFIADAKNDIEEKYADADINNNREQAVNAISLMEKLDPTRASEMREQFQKDEDAELFLSPEVKSFLDEQLFSGSLDVTTVRKLREKKIISQKTMNTYIKGIGIARNAKLSTIDKIARRRFGITDEGRTTNMENQNAIKRYQKIMEQIYTYAEDNPNASPEQIMDQYKNIAQETDERLTFEENLEESKDLLIDNTFLKRSNDWVNYLRTFGGEGLTGVESSNTMNRILRNEDETRNLIRELEELYDLVKTEELGLTKTPDGKNLDQEVPFDMRKPSEIIRTINGLKSHLKLLEQRN